MENNTLNFAVKIAGNDISEKFPIYSIETHNFVNQIPFCVVKIIDLFEKEDSLMIQDNSFKIGNEVDIELGYDDNSSSVFKGVLVQKGLNMDARSGQCFLELLIKDKSYALCIANKTQIFSEKTDADIVKSIISDAGLTPKIQGMTTKHDSLTQYNITDWDFINLRAEANGMIISVEDNTINIDKPSTTASGVSAKFDEDIVDMRLNLDGNNLIDSAECKIWDVASQQSKTVKPNNVDDLSFGDIQYSDLTKVSGKQKATYIHAGLPDEAEIKALAEGIISLNRLAKIHGYVTIFGNNKVKSNTTLKLEKGASCFQGDAYISGVSHIVENGEWLTKIHIGLSGKRYCKRYCDIFEHTSNSVLAPISGLTVGTILKIEDPQNQFRVLVNIPLLHNSGEGIWCRFSTFYASNKAGGVFYPEVDDEVIIGFIENDPRFPVVIGSTYNPKNQLPIDKLEASNKTKAICTKSKLEVNFDDTDKIIVIKTPGNKSITMSDKDDSIEIVSGSDKITIKGGKIDIKCGGDLSIDAANINLKASSDINLKASSGVKIEGANTKIKGSMETSIEGGSQTTLKSSGITTVKGSLVKIN